MYSNVTSARPFEDQIAALGKPSLRSLLFPDSNSSLSVHTLTTEFKSTQSSARLHLQFPFGFRGVRGYHDQPIHLSINSDLFWSLLYHNNICAVRLWMTDQPRTKTSAVLTTMKLFFGRVQIHVSPLRIMFVFFVCFFWSEYLWMNVNNCVLICSTF